MWSYLNNISISFFYYLSWREKKYTKKLGIACRYPVSLHFSRHISFRLYLLFLYCITLSHPLLFYSPYSIASPIDIIFLSDLVIRQDYSTADYISVLSFEASLLEFLEATFARISLLKYFNILSLTCHSIFINYDNN